MNSRTSLRILQIKFLTLSRNEDLSEQVIHRLRATCQERPSHSEYSKCKDMSQKENWPIRIRKKAKEGWNIWNDVGNSLF